MGLFDKKEEVPQIPPVPSLPNLPSMSVQEKKELPELPSFPSNSKNENFNQEMVKSAVSDSSEEDSIHVDIPQDLNVMQESLGDSGIPSVPNRNTNQFLPSISQEPSNHSIGNPSKKTPLKQNEPVFVRIDKFQSAQKNFETIKDKIKEIESVIGKIREVKSKEEEELAGWSQDIEKIKSRLTQIDSEIFNQI